MSAYKVDNKKRVLLKEASPGDVLDVQYIGGGHWKIARMKTEPEPKSEAQQPTEEE